MLKSNLTKSFLTIALFSLVLAIGACKKEENPDPNPDNTDSLRIADSIKTADSLKAVSTWDFALADKIFSDAGNIADQSEDGNVETYKNGSLLSQCATVTIDIPAKRITVNFGTVNCVCYDGRNRRGIIYVDYTGPFHISGNSYVISFNNYFVDEHKIMGTRTVTNMGPNTGGNPTFTAVDANGQIVKPNNGGTIQWNSTRSNEWIAGDSTITWLDDVWLVSGSSSGTSSAGETFTANISTPLRVQVGCRWITGGILDFTPGTALTRTIDYGSGVCDALATVTISGYVVNIVLP